MLKVLVGALLVFILMGCTSPSSHIITGQTRKAVASSEVKIYSKPPPDYLEIAIVSSTNAGSTAISEQAKTNHVINLLKKEAASLGANGIILTGVNDQPVNYPITTTNSDGSIGTSSITGYLRRASGIAIFVK